MVWRVTGQFTLRDMYEQFQNIMKMGPFGQIMVNSCLYMYVATVLCYKYAELSYDAVCANEEIYIDLHFFLWSFG